MKTQNILILISLLLFVQFAFAQFFNITNQKVYGTIAGGNDIRGIDTLNNKIIMAIGTVANGTDYDKTCSIAGSDAWVVAFDYNLNEVWQNCYGGLQTEYINEILVNDNNNEILIAVTTNSGISGNKTLASFGGDDFWLVKTDANGTILSQYAYGGSNDDFFSKILLLDDGYLLCGTSKSPVSGNKTTANRGFSDYWVIKTDFNGNKVWEKVYGGTGYDGITGAISIPGTDKIILYGTSDSPIGFEKTQNSYGYSDYWLLMIDTTGNVIWDKTVGNSDGESNGSLIFYQDAIYVLAGSSAPVSGTKTCSNNGTSDVWITKLDLNGNILWDKCVGGSGGEGCLGGTVKNNNLWLACFSNSNISGHKTEDSRGGIDYWLLALDSSANILFQKTIGGSGSMELLSKVFFLTQNNTFLFGVSDSPVSGEKTLPAFGPYALWFVHAELSVGVEENSVSNAYKIYPNPANEKVYIQNEKNEIIKMELYDVTGRLILETENLKKSTLIEINLSLINNGYYVLRLTDSENTIASHKLIKQ